MQLIYLFAKQFISLTCITCNKTSKRTLKMEEIFSLVFIFPCVWGYWLHFLIKRRFIPIFPKAILHTAMPEDSHPPAAFISWTNVMKTGSVLLHLDLWLGLDLVFHNHQTDPKTWYIVVCGKSSGKLGEKIEYSGRTETI